MRIIGGQWRSRRLRFPPASITRSMPDRVREAVFSLLGAYYETLGMLPALRVADVFAGSGSMGLEALSRGAGHCTFFERDRQAVAALQENITALEAGETSTVVTRNAWTAAAESPTGGPFELIFLDPPYRDSQAATEAGAVYRFLASLAAQVGNRPIVVFHHPTKVRYDGPPYGTWNVVDQRAFGSSAITIWKR